ncbi:unnamed protein product [Amoebophrya sp. A120]|nr:unnamed protein product [Amoebophrya sp. A120]|eukprot:GSA120T00008831001.1
MKVLRNNKTAVVVLGTTSAGFILGGGPEPTAALDVGEFLGRLGLGTGTGEGTTKTNKAPMTLSCEMAFKQAKDAMMAQGVEQMPTDNLACAAFAGQLHYKDWEKAVKKNGAESNTFTGDPELNPQANVQEHDRAVVDTNTALKTCCENYGPHLFHTQISGGPQMTCQQGFATVRTSAAARGAPQVEVPTEDEVCQEFASALLYKDAATTKKAKYNPAAATTKFPGNPNPAGGAESPEAIIGMNNMLRTCCTGYGPNLVVAQNAAPAANKQQRSDTVLCC